jgi:hypothetical protein
MDGSGNGIRVLRCYLSYTTTGIQPNIRAGYCDIFENYIEKLTDFTPPGGYHLNGVSLNGGNHNCLVQRNHIVIANPDEQGNTINQTDCISLFQDFGTFPGTGTNSDGSTGYLIQDNYVGGAGYCFYLGLNSGTPPNSVNNLTFTGNKVTTAIWPDGGNYGPIAHFPVWGKYGNSESGNTWADGPDAGHSFL